MSQRRYPKTIPCVNEKSCVASTAVSGNFDSRTRKEEFGRMNARRVRWMRYESGTRTSKKDMLGSNI